MMFQSLFSWMLLWKVITSSIHTIWHLVSILVLLDVALKGGPWLTRPRYWSSFNPCSLGCCSERVFGRVPGQRGARVSILVLLDVALKDWSARWRHQRSRVSILVLLDVALKGFKSYYRERLGWGFNPCSLGCCSESLTCDSHRCRVKRFNPCSLGCCSERPRFFADFPPYPEEKTPSVYFLCLIPNYSFPHKWKKLD